MKVIIVYELRNREYDNALLLKCELEKRGYRVEILHKPDLMKISNQRCIILVPNCYTTEDYERYIYSLNGEKSVIIDLQYEQVLSQKIEEIGFHNPKGKATAVPHLCWGDNAYNRLLKHGIKESNLMITGALQLDFLRPEFSDFWYTKEELAERFNLPLNKRWLFYISSFSYVDNDFILDKTADLIGNKEFINEFKNLSTKSQIETLNWFENIISENDDFIIIYRPHPVEKENSRLEKMGEKYKGKFHCISDLSVKQWIISSDIISTWFSTSIVECYMAKKDCLILRPYQIPEFQDAAVYINSKNISNYSEFVESINNYILTAEKMDFPINKNVIKEYYCVTEKPAYIKICDFIDEISKAITNKNMNIDFKINRFKYLMANHTVVKFVIKSVYKILYKKLNFKIRSEKVRQKYAFYDWERSVVNEKKYKFDCENKIRKLNKIVRGN